MHIYIYIYIYITPVSQTRCGRSFSTVYVLNYFYLPDPGLRILQAYFPGEAMLLYYGFLCIKYP